MNDIWLTRVRDDLQANEDVVKVATALVQCADGSGDFSIGDTHVVYADEFLFQLADDLPELRAVTQAIRWLNEHGYLDIVAQQAMRRGSVLIGRLTGGYTKNPIANAD